MKNLVLSLNHNLVTGTKAFPYIAFRGFFNKLLLTTPFTHVPESQLENTTPSPPTNSPAGLMVPPAGSHLHSRFLTPLLPEKADLSVLKADQRNCVCTLDVDGDTITRVISTVYCTEEREMTNRWRVTDYTSDGRVIMSVLCQFLKRFTQGAKRKPAEEESSSRSPTPPRKRLRLWSAMKPFLDIWNMDVTYGCFLVLWSKLSNSSCLRCVWKGWKHLSILHRDHHDAASLRSYFCTYVYSFFYYWDTQVSVFSASCTFLYFLVLACVFDMTARNTRLTLLCNLRKMNQ